MKIKVCGMRDTQNIRELILLQPDYVGLIFYAPSPRNVTGMLNIAQVRSISATQKVGVFVDASVDFIQQQIETYKLDLVQLHGNESPAFCQRINKLNVGLIKVFSIGQGMNFDRLNPYESFVDFFLFDTKGKQPGGNGIRFNWEILADYPSQKPYFLSGGISPQTAKNLLAWKDDRLHAIDINSQFEIKPAYKDLSKIGDFMTALAIKK